MLDVLVSVVTHDHAETLDSCLTSLRKALAGTRAEVVIVDTESHDATEGVARQHDIAWVPVMNRGFGAANNTAIGHAKSRWTLVLNPDVVIGSWRIADVIARAECSAVAALGVRQIDEYGNPRRAWFDFPDPLARWLRASPAPDLCTNNDVVTVDWIMGAFMLVRTEALRAIGGFDEDFFLFFEEVDLSRRLSDADLRVGYTSEFSIVHPRTHASRPTWREVLRCQSYRQYESKWFTPWQRFVSRVARTRVHVLQSLGARGDTRDRRLLVPRVLATWGLLPTARPPDASALRTSEPSSLAQRSEGAIAA